MRLGLTSSTYQYLFGGWLFPDRSKLDFNLYGQPYPYFAQTPVHVDPAQQLEWLIEKTARLELDVIHAGIARWDDPRYLDKIKSMLARHELELMPAIAGDFVNTGDEAKKAIDSPSLRFLFDTGNTLTVCEDPVDAALDAAKHTVLVHLKDLRVHPWNPGREFVSVMYACPLGRGHVDNRRILEIMREQAPDPKNLCLSLELMPMPPNEDEDRWVDASIAYAKQAFAEFLN